MNRKQIVAVAMVLSISIVMSSVTVMAQEMNLPVNQGTQNKQESQVKQAAPTIKLPENLQAQAGVTLHEIALPENWTWADSSTVVSNKTTKYAAHFIVDDKTYDYTAVEGYHAEEHYVERMLTVTAVATQHIQLQSNASTLRGAAPVPYNTGDVTIDENTFPDDRFRGWVEAQSYGHDGTITQEEISNITNIYLKNMYDIYDLKGIEIFTALEVLDCSGTGIKNLDLSKNLALIDIECHSTKLSSLNIASTKLMYLKCQYTNITSLDLRHCTELRQLNCSQTKITSLDISQNNMLNLVAFNNTPIVWIDTGVNPNLDIDPYDTFNSTVDAIGNTFDIDDIFNGIDLTKLTMISNGSIDYQTGIVTIENAYKPVTYSYDCGTSKNGKVTMQVNLTPNITKIDSSSITIRNDLDKVYDGYPVNPIVNTTGSTGDVSFTCEKYNGTEWEPYTIGDGTPSSAGKYRIKAHLATDGFYNEAESVKKEFTISQAKNNWSNELSINGWTFGDKSDNPIAKAKFGDIIYTYSDLETGTFSDTVPTNAGTWYVKASIIETSDYAGLESIKSFIISQANNSWINELSINGWTFGDKPNSPIAKAKFGDIIYTYSDLETGTFSDTVPTNAGTWYVKASIIETNDYTGLETIIPFEIHPKNVENNNQILISLLKDSHGVNNLMITDGDKRLVNGRDYEVTTKQIDNKVIFTIEFKGNYIGTIMKTYTMDENKKMIETDDITTVRLWGIMTVMMGGIIVLLNNKKCKEDIKE